MTDRKDEEQPIQSGEEESQDKNELTENELEEEVGGEWQDVDPEPIPIQTWE